jgi:hypothetical protein
MRPADLIDAQCPEGSRALSLAFRRSKHEHLVKSKQTCAGWRNNLSVLLRKMSMLDRRLEVDSSVDWLN